MNFFNGSTISLTNNLTVIGALSDSNNFVCGGFNVTVAGATTIGADAIGGNGANGGTGGAALAGFAAVDAQNNLAGASNISLQALVVSGH